MPAAAAMVAGLALLVARAAALPAAGFSATVPRSRAGVTGAGFALGLSNAGLAYAGNEGAKVFQALIPTIHVPVRPPSYSLC